MNIKASISKASITQLNNKINQINKNLTNAKKQIAEEEVLDAKQRITFGKTDPDGRPWAPWSISTMRQRTRERNLQRGLLYRTGRLLNSIKSRISGDRVEIYTNTDYAGYLQRGTTKMRPREILGFGRQSIDRIKNRLKGALTK